MTPEISIVLVVRDAADRLLRCLTALARLPEPPHFELIVVDDGSTDGTPDLLAGLEGDVQVITNAEAVGFAAACDQAAARARADRIVLLREDSVPCDGWLEPLLVALDSHPVALPRAVDVTGRSVPDPLWGALAARKQDFQAVGGFAGTSQPGRAEKASLLGALGTAGVARVPESVVLQLR
jgi:glycosyltransferase involved in cell wall biosynthesis